MMAVHYYSVQHIEKKYTSDENIYENTMNKHLEELLHRFMGVKEYLACLQRLL